MKQYLPLTIVGLISALALVFGLVGTFGKASSGDVRMAQKATIDSAATMVAKATSTMQKQLNDSSETITNRFTASLTHYVSTTDMFGDDSQRPRYISEIYLSFNQDSAGTYQLNTEGELAPETTYTAVPILNLIVSGGKTQQPLLTKVDTSYHEDSSWVSMTSHYELPKPGQAVAVVVTPVQPLSTIPQSTPVVRQTTVSTTVAVKDTVPVTKKKPKKTIF